MACLTVRNRDHRASALGISFIGACILIGGCGVWPPPRPSDGTGRDRTAGNL